MASLRQLLRHPERGPAHVGLGVRSHVVLHHVELDHDLAAGAGPRRTPEHAERARQLLGRRVRRELAGGIDGILARAARPPHWHSAALPIDAAAVLAARAELEALRDALLGEARCSCRGVAQASILLHDEHSPVYTAGAGVTVAVVAAAARAALSAGADELPGV